MRKKRRKIRGSRRSKKHQIYIEISGLFDQRLTDFKPVYIFFEKSFNYSFFFSDRYSAKLWIHIRRVVGKT